MVLFGVFLCSFDNSYLSVLYINKKFIQIFYSLFIGFTSYARVIRVIKVTSLFYESLKINRNALNIKTKRILYLIFINRIFFIRIFFIRIFSIRIRTNIYVVSNTLRHLFFFMHSFLGKIYIKVNFFSIFVAKEIFKILYGKKDLIRYY